MIEIDTNNTNESNIEVSNTESATAEKAKKLRKRGLVVTLIGVACIILFIAWLFFKLSMFIKANDEFVRSDKQVETTVVSVNVSRELETRTDTSSTTDRRGHKKKKKYQVAIYRGSYAGASDSYETKDLTDNYSGTSDAVYLSGVLWWHGKELHFEQLSIKNFPNYDEKSAYDPQGAGSGVIYNQMIKDYAILNVLATSSIFVGIICLFIGANFRGKAKRLRKTLSQGT